MKAPVLAATALVTLSACGIAFAGGADSRSWPVTGFDRIDVSGAPDVIVTTGTTAAVSATGDQARVERLEVKVDNGVLRLRDRGTGSWLGSNGKLVVRVGVPMLRGVGMSGAGTVRVNRIEAPAFDGRVSGAGDLFIDELRTARADFGVSGAGTIKAAGNASEAHASVSGAGDVKIGALRTNVLTASVSGAGDVDAFATQTANLRVSGAGDIRVRGGARCTTAKSGAGSVDCG